MQTNCTDPDAVKFQRLFIASMALAALVLQRIEPIYGILILNAPGLIGGARLSPAILIYHGISSILGRPLLKVTINKRSAVVLFDQSPILDRLIYGLFTITSLGLLMLHSAWPLGVWIFAGYIAAMMFLSGTTGFCMGAVLYVGINRLLSLLGINPIREQQ
ncbi:MAG: DUF4395 family protein [Nitrospirae bacterium]|nr:DUF4395 family protein [Nitrospirota bacterium]